jgi:predicted nucleotidyltransferase
MGKKYGKCKLCKSDNFLNYAGLCKKCNRKDKSSKIKEELAEKKQEALETQKEKQRQKTEENIEKRALEEKDDLTAEQKKRLAELTPGIKTISELEKERE